METSFVDISDRQTGLTRETWVTLKSPSTTTGAQKSLKLLNDLLMCLKVTLILPVVLITIIIFPVI